MVGSMITRGVTIEWAALYYGRRSTLAGIIGARGPDGNELMRSRIEIERSPASKCQLVTYRSVEGWY